MDKPGPDNLEMRRLESLGDTIFGVAMTLLASCRLRQSSPILRVGPELYISMLRG